MSEVSRGAKPLSESEEVGRKKVEEQIGTAVAKNKDVSQLRGSLIRAARLGIISKKDAQRTAIGVEPEKKSK